MHAGALLRQLTPETIDAVLAVVGPDADVPLILCEIRHMGGALRPAPVAGNAGDGRDTAYALSAVGLLTPDTADTTPAVLDAVEPWTTGHTSVNLHGPVGDETDRARAWETPAYRRLTELSRQMYPAGLLRREHAIG